ncbi:hypothetical protein scyTo_0003741 [Scyliorhinus torazame]|uniref:Uncharacterized protein n=1 Tax=Scyliorhinus torazame TaxID=75743 RepID=A0A401PNC3_SCYTO|nr:hypothetical protein [Scyliorhinus torazame]
MRRSVSEMQLMHDLGRLLYGSRRQELIKDVVRDVHTAGEKGLTLHAEPSGLKHPSSRKHLSSTGKQLSRLKNRRQRYGKMVYLILKRPGLVAILYTMGWMMLCDGNPIGESATPPPVPPGPMVAFSSCWEVCRGLETDFRQLLDHGGSELGHEGAWCHVKEGVS